MASKQDFSFLEGFTRETLVVIAQSQAAQLHELGNRLSKAEEDLLSISTELAAKNQRIAELEKKLLEQQQASMRQAAPFRREKKAATAKKKSGRSKGHPGNYRPKPTRIDEEVEVKLDCCPGCSGPVKNLQPVEQFIQEIPPVSVHTTRLLTYRGNCSKCGKVSSTHPLQVSHAVGAAGTHLGPNAITSSLKLMFEFGLSKRKASAVLHQLTGLEVSPSGLVQLSYRMKDKLEPDFEQLQQQVKQSPVVYCDETSWYVGQPGHWLWVFSTPTHTLYLAEPSRSSEVVHKALGKDYKGVVVSDCYVVYDKASEVQQKCYAHHLRAISKAQELRKESQYLQKLQSLLKTAMQLEKLKQQLSQQQWKQSLQQLEKEADHLLSQTRADQVEEQVANRLRKQQKHLFTFLYYEQVDATNNRAERMIRPAVISRKVSCGNKTHKGKEAWQCHTSLIVSHKQQQKDFSLTVRYVLKNSL
jgi:transposase